MAVAADAKPTILVAEKLGKGGVDMLKEVGTVDCSYDLSKEELLAKISLVDAIVIRSATKVGVEGALACCNWRWAVVRRVFFHG